MNPAGRGASPATLTKVANSMTRPYHQVGQTTASGSSESTRLSNDAFHRERRSVRTIGPRRRRKRKWPIP
jgi:hypothetical protein